jgi:hypothetical protein
MTPSPRELTVPILSPANDAEDAPVNALRDVLARVERIREALEDGDVVFVEVALEGLLADHWAAIEAPEVVELTGRPRNGTPTRQRPA